MEDARTIIIGGGIVGLSTAYYLARRGAPVTVLESGDLTTSASCGNAGIIALGHPPLPRPGLVLQALKWMFDPTSPLYVPMRLDLDLMKWMWQFRRACTKRHFERSTRVLSELGHAAGECFDTILADEGIECSYRPRGWLDIYRTDAARKHGRFDADLIQQHGYDVQHLDRNALHEREPAFDGSVIGATHYTDSASMDPGEFLRALALRAASHGAEIRDRTPVERLLRDGARVLGVVTREGQRHKAQRVVLAAGSWTTELARGVGVKVPMQPGKGYHVSVPQLDPPLNTACVLNERHVAVTPMGDRLRLAGTIEMSGMNLRIHPRRIAMLTECVTPYLPAMKGAETSGDWCGLRPCTADGLPIIGWAPRVHNLFIATGHAKMGLSLGPITGRVISEWLLDGKPAVDVSALTPERFG